MKIGILGRTHLLIDTVKALIQANHEIVFIYTCRAEPHYKATEQDFKTLATSIGCPFYNDLDVYSKLSELKALGADLCISINWLLLLKNSFLNMFKFGVLNAHAGDLPRYRGNACPNWAILNFEDKIGLTIHKMTEELDAGPYLTKLFFPIDENTYIGDIYHWLENITPQAFLIAIETIFSQGFIEQSTSIKALRTYPRKPEDSKIIWDKSARDILALIRASSRPFAGAFCYLNEKKITVYKARLYEPNFSYCAIPGQVCLEFNKNPVVATGEGLIEIQESIVCIEEELISASSIIVSSFKNRLT